MARAVAVAARVDRLALFEALVRGREFTLAVLDDRPLPLLEIVAPEPIFSYEAKYASSLTEYRLDFELGARREPRSRASGWPRRGRWAPRGWRAST